MLGQPRDHVTNSSQIYILGQDNPTCDNLNSNNLENLFMTRQQLFIIFLRVAGIAMIANAAWMALSAHHWFMNIPADLSATGNANLHFIHDVAAAYFTFGVGLIWCAANIEKAYPVYLGATLFMVAHGVSHVLEIIAGQLPHSHWLIDLPLVFIPGLFMALLAIPTVWEKLTTFK